MLMKERILVNKREIKATRGGRHKRVLLLLKNSLLIPPTSCWLTLQIRVWTVSMYVHVCMTHPAMFIFGPVIRVWFQAKRYLVSKCSVQNLTGDTKHRTRKCS